MRHQHCGVQELVGGACTVPLFTGASHLTRGQILLFDKREEKNQCRNLLFLY